jgi:hypothetical protein
MNPRHGDPERSPLDWHNTAGREKFAAKKSGGELTGRFHASFAAFSGGLMGTAARNQGINAT